MTVHLAALDHLQHESGPFSEESNLSLEHIDKLVGDLEDAARVFPNVVVCIVSDHGFARTDPHVEPARSFRRGGTRYENGRKGHGLESDSEDRRGICCDLIEGSEGRSDPDQSGRPAKATRGGSGKWNRWDNWGRKKSPRSERGRTRRSGSICGPTSSSRRTMGLWSRRRRSEARMVTRRTHPELLASFFIAGPGVKRGRRSWRNRHAQCRRDHRAGDGNQISIGGFKVLPVF